MHIYFFLFVVKNYLLNNESSTFSFVYFLFKYNRIYVVLNATRLLRIFIKKWIKEITKIS